ncbi:hypothetical protein GCM10023259_012550 [Thermocatellispora tengchongensis]
MSPPAPGAVAEPAAGRARGAMPLDRADLVEAVGVLTFRDEAKLAGTGLRRRDQASPTLTPIPCARFLLWHMVAACHWTPWPVWWLPVWPIGCAAACRGAGRRAGPR